MSSKAPRSIYQEDIRIPDSYHDDYKKRAKAAGAAKMRVEMDITYFDLGSAQPDGGEEEVGELMAGPKHDEATHRKISMPEDVSEMRLIIVVRARFSPSVRGRSCLTSISGV